MRILDYIFIIIVLFMIILILGFFCKQYKLSLIEKINTRKRFIVSVLKTLVDYFSKEISQIIIVFMIFIWIWHYSNFAILLLRDDLVNRYIVFFPLVIPIIPLVWMIYRIHKVPRYVDKLEFIAFSEYAKNKVVTSEEELNLENEMTYDDKVISTKINIFKDISEDNIYLIAEYLFDNRICKTKPNTSEDLCFQLKLLITGNTVINKIIWTHKVANRNFSYNYQIILLNNIFYNDNPVKKYIEITKNNFLFEKTDNGVASEEELVEGSYANAHPRNRTDILKEDNLNFHNEMLKLTM